MDNGQEALAQRWNKEIFDGRLPDTKLDLLAEVANFDQEVIDFIDGALRHVRSMGLSAEDFSELLAWEMGFLLPRILPTAWGGMVPPITVARRHEAIDEYLAVNPWHGLEAGSTLLDVGCGFPPLTAVDLARRFPECRVTGADPQFGRWIVYDVRGDYAAFRDDGTLRYFQAPESDFDFFDELLAGGQATHDRYRAILDRLLPELDGQEGYARVERDGQRLVQDPIEEHSRDNLSFVLGGFGEADVPGDFDIVRSMNVLIYFDSDFRRSAEEWVASILKDGGLFVCGMNWVRSEYSRYSVFQKEGGRLVHREFAFGLENVRPLEIVPFFAFFEDEKETAMLFECVGILRQDDAFMRLLNERLDAAQADLDFCARRDDGHLGGVEAGMSFGEMEPKLLEFMARANSDELHEAARPVLERAGFEVWRNEVGHTAVRRRS